MQQLLQAFTLPKVWLFFAFCLIALVLLVRGLVTKKTRMIGLGLTLFTFGILSALPLGAFVQKFAMHPSPVCMIEKPLIFLSRGKAIPLFFISMLLSVIVLSIIGNKLFCGWVCPLGAFQELLHKIPVSKIRVPFKLSNIIRVVFFAAFVIVLLTAGISLLEYVSGFEFFHFNWGLLGIIVIVIIAAASLFIFRPFCYFLCPLGLLTWLAEHIAIFRVYKKDIDCGSCRICIEKSPCPSVEAIVDGAKSRPDCHACGECLKYCPSGKLQFTVKK